MSLHLALPATTDNYINSGTAMSNEIPIESWLQLDLTETERKNTEQFLELSRGSRQGSREEELIAESFSNPLVFGTGGLRGRRGPGPGCMNRFTVSRAAESFFNVLKKRGADTKPLVVIGGDSRLQSPEFILLTAWQAYKAGFQPVIYERPVPTPLLSYAIRSLGGAGGVVITASHNPREYNGFKAYLEDGGQIVSPVDKQTLEGIREYKGLESLSFPELSTSLEDLPELPYPLDVSGYDWVEAASPEIFEAYLKDLEGTVFGRRLKEMPSEKLDFCLVYSPLHGTGGEYMPAMLRHFGINNVALVEEQTKPDGNFPTVIFPNPEEAEALTLAEKLAAEKKAALYCATDPDSDRLGVGLRRSDGSYEMINGNQLGSLMAAWLIEQCAGMPGMQLFKTIVTTDLQRDIAEANNLAITDVLTGFKYIADEMNKLDAARAAGEKRQYLFGGEESYGYLAVDFVHDKDSLSAALLLCCILADKGDLLKYLNDIYLKYGLYREGLVSLTLEGSEGRQQIDSIIARMSGDLPDGLFTRKVLGQVNLEDQSIQGEIPPRLAGDIRKLPSSRVIQLFLEDAKITVRPSGTEPKIKFYFSFKHPDKMMAENLDAAVRSLNEEIGENSKRLLEFCKQG
jgi:phosphomannomutase